MARTMHEPGTMVDSPRDYSASVTLKDGASLVIRALRGTDKMRVMDLFRRLSPGSIRYRAFASKSILTPKELDYLVDVDFVNHVALAAVFRDAEKELIVGIGRYCCVRPSGSLTVRAEVAFTVSDEDQGRGIGTLLLEHLASIARVHGIDELEADVMIDNAKMMEVLRDSGFTLRRSLDDGVYRVLFPTAATTRFLEVSHARHLIAVAKRV